MLESADACVGSINRVSNAYPTNVPKIVNIIAFLILACAWLDIIFQNKLDSAKKSNNALNIANLLLVSAFVKMDIYWVKIRKAVSTVINLSFKFLQECNVYANRDMLETARESALLLLFHLLVKKINIIMLKVNAVFAYQDTIKFLASVLRFLSVMLILIGMAKVVLAKLDLL